MSSQTKRQLLTVMFSDMVGYSRLMNEDEEYAIQLRNRMEHQLRLLVPVHNGNVQQFYGDGALCLFTSAVEAVQCAAAIQAAFKEPPIVPVRIGLHTGDVLLDGTNVYGESVNVASRIESFSVPGAVLFSEKVYDDIKNHAALKVKSLGPFRLKNIQHEVGLYALEHPTLTVPDPKALQGKGYREKRSIAVLPFVNMSPDPENEYFSDGISEELLNTLAREAAFKVTARTSSFAFKGANEDMRSIGKKLGVDTILEGSVRKSGNRVRITAQLINTEDGYHLFSETYNRTLDDIFAVQDEISADIANKLKARLGLTEQEHQAGSSGSSPAKLEAYNLYLKGLFQWNQYTPEAAATAIGLFKQSLELDPRFAKAWAYLSFCYSFLGASGNWPTEQSLPHAKEAAERALSLDDSLELAYCALGIVHLFLDWNMEAAEKIFERARAINPNSTAYMYTYSLLLRAEGRFDEGAQVLERAIELDPVSIIAHTYLADMYIACGEQEMAIDTINKIQGLHPENEQIRCIKAWILLATGKLDEAEDILMVQLPEGHSLFKEYVASRGVFFSKKGNLERARKCLARLKKMHEESPRDNDFFDIGLLATQLQYYEQAYQATLEAIGRRLGGVIFILNHPMWKGFRQSSYFKDVLNRMGISEKWVRN